MMVKKFMLIEVIERNVSEPGFFDTHDDAYNEMKDRYEKTCDPSDCDSHISEDYAYGESANHENCDWEIFEISIPVEALDLKEFEGDVISTHPVI